MNFIQRSQHFFGSFTRPNPERDWFFALVVLVVPFLFFILYAGYMFFGIQSGLIVHSSAVPFPAQTVTAGEIESVLEVYRTRKTNYDAHTASELPIVEPARGVGQ